MISLHMNATQGGANLHPGAKIHPSAKIHSGANTAHEHGFRIKAPLRLLNVILLIRSKIYIHILNMTHVRRSLFPSSR